MGATQKKNVSQVNVKCVRQRGIAMMLVLGCVVVATVLSLGYIASQQTTVGITQNVNTHAEARAIAESALMLAIDEIRNNSNWRDDYRHGKWLTVEDFSGAVVQITGEDGYDRNEDGRIEGDDETDGDLSDDMTDRVTITATATINGVSHTVHTVVTPGESTMTSRLLMVVDDEANLTQDEETRVSEIESFGYEVILITDSSSLSSYDTALGEADVVYVTREAQASAIGDKLTNTGLGVVCEQSGTWDNLGFSAGASVFSSATINITDNTHYITSPFSLGTLTIGSATMELVQETGGVSTGQYLMAESPFSSNGVLATMDIGAEHQDTGEPIVGRRAVLPWGGPGFDFDLLNANGLTIMERAIYWAAQPPEGPPAVAHWKMDDGSGAIATDSNGGHDGTVSGGSPWNVGQVDGSIQMDGVDDFIEVPDHTDFDVTDALSISAWIKADSFGSGENVDVILRKGEGNPNVWQFGIDDGSVALFLDEYDTDGSHSDASLDVGKWYHVAATWDGSRIRFYINGELDSSQSRSGTIGTDDRPIYIGGRTGSPGYDRFDGLIDDVRFYNRALNPLEIEVMYEEGIAAGLYPQAVLRYQFSEVKPSPTLVGHWTLDDDTTGGGGIAVSGSVDINDTARVDSYESERGKYSVNNYGRNALVSTNSTSTDIFNMDVSASVLGDTYCGAGGNPDSAIEAHEGSISGDRLSLASNISIPNNSAPSGMPGGLGNLTVTSPVTWSSDMTVTDLTLRTGAVVTVSGDVRVHVEDDMTIEGDARVNLVSGGSLTIYVRDKSYIRDNAVIGSSEQTRQLKVVSYNSSDEILIEDAANFSGMIECEGRVRIREKAEFFGGILATSLLFEDTARIHVDRSLPNLGIASPPAIDETDTEDGEYQNGTDGKRAGAGVNFGNSAYFDGSNDHIEVDHNDSHLLRSGAIACWFKTTTVNETQGILSKDSDGFDDGGQFTIRLNGGVVQAVLESNSTAYTLTSGSIGPSWNHVVFCWGPDGLKLYRNGALEDSHTYVGGTGSTSGGTGNTEPLAIGVDTSQSGDGTVSGYTHAFEGFIDDVRIYNYALDGDQVNAVYTGNDLPDSTLPGSTVYDSSNYGGALDLQIDDTSDINWPTGGGLEIAADMRLMTESNASKVEIGISERDQFTVELMFAPSDIAAMNGQIFSFGSNNSQTNLRIGQDMQQLEMRLRTSSTTSGGTPTLESPNFLNNFSRRHALIIYDGEYVYWYVDGSMIHSETRTGELDAWDETMYFAVANDVDADDPWRGTIYGIVIWDRAMVQSQIKNLFAGRAPGLPGESSDFKARWLEKK